MVFAVPKTFDDQRQADHNTFCCPKGHRQSYTGKTPAQKLREKVKQLEQQLQAEMENSEQGITREQHAERRISALKGQITRWKKKAQTSPGQTIC